MKSLLFLLALTLFSFASMSNSHTLEPNKEKNQAQILELLVQDYTSSLQLQRQALESILKSKHYSQATKKKVNSVLPIVAATIKDLSGYKKKYNVSKLSTSQIKKVGRSLLQQGHNAMQDADKIIVIVIGGGDDDGGGDNDKPDCSGVFNSMNGACTNGVNIKMRCGFYNENGGSQAVEQALEKCTMDANAAVSSCESGSNTNTFGQESAYESNAMMVCSQFENDGLEPNAGQTETSTGN